MNQPTTARQAVQIYLNFNKNVKNQRDLALGLADYLVSEFGGAQ